ncbi:MAG: hypothetical protein COX80_03060 [Candidatus Magasanikbacteria bacterium CG_4_10_14_0_2_um_filter_33_14]|uniref:Sporulation stage II protein D amidase enhancer LytB N-terminal domain-containing protein n=1 Tax=Candidatus Magasanikbacteria bacterium CG_4_10_14_0_2_um_filter_33_14 TaxID=1974636 RepID=A0A2M7VAA6_9BACT|nr:MAG: hypothetical protein COX80_03060 [Candidatus Magasanikbacteria bacterium CG_4_10_14_0_2_um_filter_33_14]
MFFKKIFSFFIISLVFITSFAFSPSVVQAALPDVSIRDDSFAAKYVSQSISDPVKIEAGSTITVDIKFKNVGTKTWNASSGNYISAYTMEPRYHSSDFSASSWVSKSQTSKISGAVKPGEVGTLSLQLTAPEKTGTYTEKFWLAAENYSWLKDGYFYLKINVVAKTASVQEETKVTEEISKTEDVTTSNEYKAKQFILNTKNVTARGGEKVSVILGVQNLGTATWQKYSIVANSPVSLAGESLNNLTFADATWKDNNTVLEKDKKVAQWDVIRDTFSFVAPAKAGSYTLNLKLKADDSQVSGLDINIPVTVTSNAPNYVENVTNNNNIINEVPRLSEEPFIRIGVWQNPEDKVKFLSDEDDYVVYAGDVMQGILGKGVPATTYYQDGIYYFNSVGLDFSGKDFVRLVPRNNLHAVFTLVNYNRAVTWKGPVNFNKYRGTMELRKINNGDDVYVIEETYMEDYVAGIAETSNAGPTEYIKALLTAARTYAYYVKEYTTKHDARNFDVVAHTGDQLYLGYASEVLMPNVAAAQKATRGYMVTYNNDIVITPYYSTSDGRTRNWTDVWGGSAKPWLVSVTAPYDLRDGKAMYGHGVGMSARDAAYMADEEGISWQEILHHYYTDVEISVIYK